MMNFGNLKEKLGYFMQRLSEGFNLALSSERDRRAMLIGLSAVICLMAFFTYQSFSKSYKNNNKKIEVLENDLAQIRSLKKQYKTSELMLRQMTKSVKKEEEALISVVERILVESQIERTSFSIKDSNFSSPGSEDLFDEKSVQVDIRRVSFNQIVDALYRFQVRGSFLKVSDLRLKTKFDNPDLIDASFKLSTFEFKKVI